MGRLQPGQRALRRNIVRDLQQQGYDKVVVQRSEKSEKIFCLRC